MAFFWAPGCSSWFLGILGTEVDDGRGGSYRRCFTALLYLAAKPAHVGIDMGGIATPCTDLSPTAVRCGDRASCQVLSYPVIVAGQ
jgi:hypothetical protein